MTKFRTSREAESRIYEELSKYLPSIIEKIGFDDEESRAIFEEKLSEIKKKFTREYENLGPANKTVIVYYKDKKEVLEYKHDYNLIKTNLKSVGLDFTKYPDSEINVEFMINMFKIMNRNRCRYRISVGKNYLNMFTVNISDTEKNVLYMVESSELENALGYTYSKFIGK